MVLSLENIKLVTAATFPALECGLDTFMSHVNPLSASCSSDAQVGVCQIYGLYIPPSPYLRHPLIFQKESNLTHSSTHASYPISIFFLLTMGFISKESPTQNYLDVLCSSLYKASFEHSHMHMGEGACIVNKGVTLQNTTT